VRRYADLNRVAGPGLGRVFRTDARGRGKAPGDIMCRTDYSKNVGSHEPIVAVRLVSTGRVWGYRLDRLRPQDDEAAALLCELRLLGAGR
jgi:hypothetical protein